MIRRRRPSPAETRLDGPDGTSGGREPAHIPDAAGPEIDAPQSFRLPGYEIVGELGRGGGGTVYAARQRSVKRLVAIKAVVDLGTGTALARVRQEAEVLAQLRHPNIAPVLDLLDLSEGLFLVMPLFAGGTVERLTASGNALSLGQVVGLMSPIADALDAIHEAGIVHRDVKPSNILLDERGTPTLADFGLAVDAARARLTGAGFVVGTPGFIAPEVARGEGVTPAADIWSFGVVLQELVDRSDAERDRAGAVDEGGAAIREVAAQCTADDPAGRPVHLAAVLDELGVPAQPVTPAPISIGPMLAAPAPPRPDRPIGLDLLGDIGGRARAAFLAATDERRFEAGATIFGAGEPGTEIHLVASGHVLIRTPVGPAAGKVVSLHGPGSHFGELSLVSPGPRSADAIALDAVVTRTLSGAQLDELATEHPEIEAALTAALAQTIRAVSSYLVFSLHASPAARVAHRLRALGAMIDVASSDHFALPMDVAAELVGLAPDALVDLLRTTRLEAACTVTSDGLRVADAALLEQIERDPSERA